MISAGYISLSLCVFQQTAFAWVKVFGMSGGLALGYFAAGCAPGGGSSNMYTYLLGGDVSLSVTMTLISIIASLGNRCYNVFVLLHINN